VCVYLCVCVSVHVCVWGGQSREADITPVTHIAGEVKVVVCVCVCVCVCVYLYTHDGLAFRESFNRKLNGKRSKCSIDLWSSRTHMSISSPYTSLTAPSGRRAAGEISDLSLITTPPPDRRRQASYVDDWS